MKDKYIKVVKDNYKGEALNILLKQIELFFSDSKDIKLTKYDVGEDVFLKKGTYMHGIPSDKEHFDWTVENGFIGNDFTDMNTPNKIRGSIGMWQLKEDTLLKDYIIKYSGFTITYTIGRGPGSIEVSDLIPYHQFDKYTEELNNREDVWMYWGDQTKELRFMPSLVADKRQIAFILNMDSPYAKEISSADVWNPNYDKIMIKDFIDYRYYDKFLVERLNRNATTTDRETAIMFGLPSKLIEGVLVGRKLENDQKALEYIKNRLPNCYICNLEGKVIVGNK